VFPFLAFFSIFLVFCYFYCIVNLIIDIGLQPMSDTFCRGKKYIYNAEKFLRKFLVLERTRSEQNSVSAFMIAIS